MLNKLTVLLLLTTLVAACGKVPIERVDPATAQVLPEEPVTPEPEPEPEPEGPDQETIDRLTSQIDVFIADVEAELTPSADPNLSGIWLSVWANAGNESGTINGQNYEDTFEGFGFDVIFISDDGAGTLIAEDYYNQDTVEINYDQNDNLSVLGENASGDVIDSNHFSFDPIDFEESGTDQATGDSYTATGTYINKFIKLSNNFADTIGLLTATSTSGSADFNIQFSSYWEYAYTNANGTDRFFAFIDEDFDLVEVHSDEEDVSISRTGENITVVAGDDDPNQVFIFDFSFN